MGKRDNAPVPHTCPKIDEVISAIKSVEWGDNSFWDETRLVELMEEIRSANDSLRTWGNEKHKECDELQDQVSDYEQKICELSSIIEEFEEQESND